MRNAILGALVGFAVGWLVFGEREGPERAERGDRSVVGDPEAEPEQAKPKKDESPEALSATSIEAADANELRSLVHRDSAGASAAAVAAAIQRVDQARTARDWKLFTALLQFLASTDSIEAQAKLIELMGDTSLRFHDWRVAEHFVWGLSTTEIDGAARAARERIEFESREYTDANRWGNWYEIVAKHGSIDDVAWLVTHARKSGGGMRYIAEALAAGSGNDAAARQYIELWKQGWQKGDRPAREFAKNNPALALPFFQAQFAAEQGGSSRALARNYGQAVTEDTLAEAKRFLLGLGGVRKRAHAADAVTAMHRNKLDISGLEPILRAPVDLARSLVTVDEKTRDSRFYEVLYGIEYNKLTWTEQAAQALDDSARAYENKSRGDAYIELARRIRAKLGTDAAGWVTKD